MSLPLVQIQAPVERFVHEDVFKQVPSIYAIEVTSACNLECPMCFRSANVIKQPSLLNPDLLKLMHFRGDFSGSYYIELQLAGEPTIHPDLNYIIDFLQNTVGVKVGLSTHGLNMTKALTHATRLPVTTCVTTAELLLRLDALTISVDSVDPETYHKMRYPSKLEALLSNLDFFFYFCARYKQAGKPLPFIELQLVKSRVAERSGDYEALEQLVKEKGWDEHCSVRTTNDCFYEMSGREPVGSQPRNADVCLTPFLEVNVSQDGDVVSCCYVFDTIKTDINYYGNLWMESLANIWNGPRVKAMQASQCNGKLQGLCTKCYYKSTSLIHLNILSRLTRARKGR